jgi:CBS domain-containing protein
MPTNPRKTLVKEIMQRKVHTVYSNQTIFDAAVLMSSKSIGTIPVINEEENLTGILTDRDIVTNCIAIGKEPKKTKVSECMTLNPIRTVPSSTIGDAITLISEYGVRRLPIVEKDKLVGLVSISDISAVSSFCQNERFPNDSCILIEIAKETQKSSLIKDQNKSCNI